MSLTVLHHIHAQVGESLPIISVGGVTTVDDVLERLKAGASLIQVYTSLVYKGPLLVKQLNKGVLAELKKRQLSSLEAVIGKNT